jgi:hypothetical protein
VTLITPEIMTTRIFFPDLSQELVILVTRWLRLPRVVGLTPGIHVRSASRLRAVGPGIQGPRRRVSSCITGNLPDGMWGAIVPRWMSAAGMPSS